MCLTVAVPALAQKVLPTPTPKFRGKIEVRATSSTAWFPPDVTPPPGAPNVFLVMLDDVGYGASSTFGGLINTPTLDKLAQNGLRYTQFHTTAMCSPTRAALLTGRNHHPSHNGVIVDHATGFPGYDSLMGQDTATIGEVLRHHGYATSWFGKNHIIPDWRTSQVGPFDQWPLHIGFDFFYGFIGGDTNQWRPAAFEGIKPIEPYLNNPDYNFDYDIADQAIARIREQKSLAPNRPFFVYYVPGATHAPHQPKKQWADKYKGKFDMGYNVARQQIFERQKQLGVIPANAQLTATPGDIPPWDTLPAEKKRVFARMMELYAGFLEQTDYNVGRVIQAIEQTGQLDNTLIIYIVGDNGASPEGTLQGQFNEMTMVNALSESFGEIAAHYNDLGTSLSNQNYPAGWAHAMSTPFKWEKQVASHFGGTRNGLVISWPARIQSRGGIRTQFHHIVDIAPTLFEAIGIQPPVEVNGVKQKPLEGVSMLYSFDNPAAPSTHKTQYFEMYANRAMYNEGWIASTTPPYSPYVRPQRAYDVIDDYKWELYELASDPTQANDLAQTYPGKLRQLQQLFDKEARKHAVYPLDNRRPEREDPAVRPNLARGRTSFIYYPGMTRLPEASVADVKNKSWSVTADIVTSSSADQGMIITEGGLFGGWALYLEQGRPVFHNNVIDAYHVSIKSPSPLSPGHHLLTFDFTYDGGGLGKGGEGTILVDGQEVARGRIDQTTPYRFSLDIQGLDVGLDTGTPVNLDYDVPFRFAGQINSVTIETGEMSMPVSEAEQKKIENARRMETLVE